MESETMQEEVLWSYTAKKSDPMKKNLLAFLWGFAFMTVIALIAYFTGGITLKVYFIFFGGILLLTLVILVIATLIRSRRGKGTIGFNQSGFSGFSQGKYLYHITDAENIDAAYRIFQELLPDRVAKSRLT